MEKKNNSGLLVGIIIGLVIAAIIGVALYSSGTISFNNNEANNNGQSSGTNATSSNVATEESTNQQSWIDYLLKQQITSITLEKIDPEKNEKQEVFLDEKQNGKIQELLQSLKTSSIKKKYAGGWGFTGGNVITIRYYAHNDNNNAFCEISISNGIIPENISDKYLLNILEKEVEKVEDEELKNETGTIFYYVIEDLRKDNFLDKYFN